MTPAAAATTGLDGLPSIGPAVLTMGVFDGVHRGHRHLLHATRDAAHARGVRGVALVFDPPPVEVLRRGTRVRREWKPDRFGQLRHNAANLESRR